MANGAWINGHQHVCWWEAGCGARQAGCASMSRGKQEGEGEAGVYWVGAAMA